MTETPTGGNLAVRGRENVTRDDDSDDGGDVDETTDQRRMADTACETMCDDSELRTASWTC